MSEASVEPAVIEDYAFLTGFEVCLGFFRVNLCYIFFLLTQMSSLSWLLAIALSNFFSPGPILSV